MGDLEVVRSVGEAEQPLTVAALKLIPDTRDCSNDQLSEALESIIRRPVRLVDKLEAAGLIESRRGADRGGVALQLTDAHRRRVRALLDEQTGALQAILDALPTERRHQLEPLAEALLPSPTDTPLAGAHSFRFCDERSCPPGRCPVHRRAVELPLAEPE